MSLSMSLASDPGNPRCFNDAGKRAVRESALALSSGAKSLLRSAVALSMIGLSLVEPRLLPLFALTVPFWIALELESKLARRFTPR